MPLENGPDADQQLNPLSYISMKDYTTLEGSLSFEKVLGWRLNCREFDRGNLYLFFSILYNKYRSFYILVFLYWDFLYYVILYLKILYSNFLYLIFLYCWFLYLFFLYFDFLYLRSKNPFSIFLFFYIMSGALQSYCRKKSSLEARIINIMKEYKKKTEWKISPC
jgi:hypothetical protein